MAKSRLSEFYNGDVNVGMESSAIENGIEIHYKDGSDEYKVDRIEGGSSEALIDSLMEGVNKVVDDDECTLLYLAVAESDDDGDDDDD